MEDEEVFTILSKCFSPVEEEDWIALTKASNWTGFLNSVRRIMQDDQLLGVQSGTIQKIHLRCPLQEFISSEGMKAMFTPPSYQEKQAFAACYFTGSTPHSTIPIESLYREESCTDDEDTHVRDIQVRDPQVRDPQVRDMQVRDMQVSDTRVKDADLFQSESACYMRDLAERIGVELPQRYRDTPDHIAVELDLLAALLRRGYVHEASSYLQQRFNWLTDFRLNLLEISHEARFYLGLVDALLGIRARQSELTEASGENDSNN